MEAVIIKLRKAKKINNIPQSNKTEKPAPVAQSAEGPAIE